MLVTTDPHQPPGRKSRAESDAPGQNNPPPQLPPLIGRDHDLAAARRQLLRAQVRVLTFTGPAGVGKTRLAVEAAASVASSFEHGAWFVDLAPTSDPALVVPAIAATLGVATSEERPSLAELKSALQEKHLLLVLDNFEQVADAAASVAELLEACRRLKIVVTSRAALDLRWEHVFPVPPLGLPELERRPRQDALMEYPAVALFVERARAVRPDSLDGDGSLRAAAQICLYLDGLPLAIELAAAQVKLLPLQAILARLQQGLDLPMSGPRDLPARQQTLRAAIDWSCDLLDQKQRTLLWRLAVFAGGCTPEAARAVCGDGEDLFEVLAALLDRNLLQRDPRAEDEPRFLMLETVRRRALERLVAAGEAEGVRDRHATYYLKLAERAEQALGGPDQAAWVDTLAWEHQNLQAALDWARAKGESEGWLRVASALGTFWLLHGGLSGCRECPMGPTPPSAEPSASGNGRGLGAPDRLARTRSNDPSAVVTLRESAAPRQERNGTQSQASSTRRPAGGAWYADEPETARRCQDESLGRSGDSAGRRTAATLLKGLATVAPFQGDDEPTTVHGGGSLALYRELAADRGTATCLVVLAKMALGQQQPERVARLLGAAHAIGESTGSPLQLLDRADYDRSLSAARAMLGEEAFRTAWTAGRAMTSEQAVEYALTPEEPPAAGASLPAESGLLDPLTRREREVARLIARGLTNGQIAQELVIVKGTVANHVEHILGKLGFSSRTQIAAWVAAGGLNTGAASGAA
ncbi:MAG TPA: LuxR C-terminal-related transcriptional regulator [Chloroflexota bacterium]|nr:LuxR C-terminal-related transcriptional regulator [Chloroflexota bacterium]